MLPFVEKRNLRLDF